MKALIKNIIFIVLIALYFMFTRAYAGDPLYRFMHNHHDALIIGKIVCIKDGYAKVKVSKKL